MSETSRRPSSPEYVPPYRFARGVETVRTPLPGRSPSAIASRPSRFNDRYASALAPNAAVEAEYEDFDPAELFRPVEEVRAPSTPGPFSGANPQLLTLGAVGAAFLLGVTLAAFAWPRSRAESAPVAGVVDAQSLRRASAIRPVSQEPTKVSALDAPAAKLALDPPSRGQAGESAPLGVSVQNPQAGGMVVVSGLARGSKLSAGASLDDKNWWLSFADLPKVTILPAQKFVGAMDLTIELRRADMTVAERVARRFEWRDETIASAQDVAPGRPDPTPMAKPSPAGTGPSGEPVAHGIIAARAELARRSIAGARQIGALIPMQDRPVPAAAPFNGESAKASLEATTKPRAAEDETVDKLKQNPPTEADAASGKSAALALTATYENQTEPKLRESAARESSQEGSVAECLVKIDGRIIFKGRCRIGGDRERSLTFSLRRDDPVQLTFSHGRTWRLSWGREEIGKVYKRASCWGGSRAYICGWERSRRG
jgi:hypothetical protein